VANMKEDDECLIVQEIKSPRLPKKTAENSKSLLLKKTKQARLPFAPKSSGGDKKRKHSGSTDEKQPPVKKPNIPKPTRQLAEEQDEVSSSCDDHPKPHALTEDSPVCDRSKPDSLLQSFVKIIPTQQDEVSTSDDIKIKQKNQVSDSLSCETTTIEGKLDDGEGSIDEQIKPCSVKIEDCRVEEIKENLPEETNVSGYKKECNGLKNTPNAHRRAKNLKCKSDSKKPNLLTSFVTKKTNASGLSPQCKYEKSSADSNDTELFPNSESNVEGVAGSKSSNYKSADDVKSDGAVPEGKVLSVDIAETEKDANISLSNESNSDSDRTQNLETESSTPNRDGSNSCQKAKRPTPKSLKALEEKKKREEEKQKKLAEKLAEKERLKKEKEEERLRKETERLEEKAKKEAERLRIKKEKEEEIRKQKEEKLEKKKKEAEAKNKEREEKIQKKKEELEAKEEESIRKEAEKLIKEEEKRKAEEEEANKKKKVAAKFANFFVVKKSEEIPTIEENKSSDCGPFKPMQIGRLTALAPTCRIVLSCSARKELDNALACTSGETYLSLLARPDYLPGRQTGTVPPKVSKHGRKVEDADDCMILDNDKDEEEDEDDDDDDDSFSGSGVIVSAAAKGAKLRGKLLQFSENRRPPYWGTWSKKPEKLNGRKPFAKESVFDYEYDSDDDWEEEEENGESLSDSEGEKEEEEDQYEVDNDFFVPHGYLSNDEAADDDDEEEGDVSEKPTNRTDQLKAKQVEFEKELKKKTKQLKPRVIGCLWQCGEVTSATEHLTRLLSPYAAVLCGDEADTPIPPLPPTPPPTPVPVALDTPRTGDTTTEKIKFLKTFPDEALPDLVRLVHGSLHNKARLVSEFAQWWRASHSGAPSGSATPCPERLSRKKIEQTIQSLAEYQRCPDEGAFFNKCMWYVPHATRTLHGLADLGLPNAWHFDFDPPKDARKRKLDDSLADGGAQPSPKSAKMAPGSSGAPANLITKFTKVLSEEEKLKALAKEVKPTQISECKKGVKPSQISEGKIPVVVLECLDEVVLEESANTPTTPRDKGAKLGVKESGKKAKASTTPKSECKTSIAAQDSIKNAIDSVLKSKAAESSKKSDNAAVNIPDNAALKKSDSPTLKKSDSPIVKKSDSLALKKSDSPAVKKIDSPALKKSDSPALKKSDSPAVKKSDSPAVKKSDSPALKKKPSTPSGHKNSPGSIMAFLQKSSSKKDAKISHSDKVISGSGSKGDSSEADCITLD